MSDDVTTSSQANASGARLKKFVRAGGDLSVIDASHPLHADVLVAQRWRAAFSSTLTGVNMGIRSMVRTCGVDGQVGQRHKRLERIVQKLARPNSTVLGKMQDIAGVRVVVPNLDGLRRLQEHVCKRWSDDVPNTKGVIVQETDYVDRPRASGYRGVHLIARYNDRLAEIQLRTQHQHFWAEMVERVSRSCGFELKAGEGPAVIMDFFVELGEHVERLDNGDQTPFNMSLDLAEFGSPLKYEVTYGDS